MSVCLVSEASVTNSTQLNTRCRAYQSDGRLCGKPAGVIDEIRNIPVCEEHATPVRYRLLERVYLGPQANAEVKQLCGFEAGTVMLDGERVSGCLLRRYLDWTGEVFELITDVPRGPQHTLLTMLSRLTEEPYLQLRSLVYDPRH